MKLYDCDHNYFGLKCEVVQQITKKINTVSVSPNDPVAPFLIHKRLPVLELDSGIHLFSSNAICRYIWEMDGNNSVTTKDEEWCEWESTTLQAALAPLLLSAILRGKPEITSRVHLQELLKVLDDHLQEHSNFSGINKTYGLSDIVVWSSIYPLYIKEALSPGFMTPYQCLSRWFNALISEEPFAEAVKQTFPKGLSAYKDSLVRLVPVLVPTSSQETAPRSQNKQPATRTESKADADDHSMSLSTDEIELASEAWKNNQNAVSELQESPAIILPEKGKKNILITSALPYVNNVPHLGNIVGSVLSADVYARYCRLRNWKTLYICGTDEYGTATETKALEMNLTPKEICDQFNKIHGDIYKWFNISFDYFGRTTTQKQTEIAQDIFLKLLKNKYLHEEVVEQLYCNKCDRFLADRFVEGICPFCTYEDARGDQCDLCSKLINPTELKEARCKVCKEAPVLNTSQHFFIDLPKLEPAFMKWYKSKVAGDEWTQTAKVITGAWIRDGLKPRCITRDLKWGTPVPLEGYGDKVFYVWFDAPIGYLSITANYTEHWEKWWKQPDEVQLYQFMAKDNVPFHGIVFPMTQLGTHERYTTVDHLIAVEYLNYEDSKFSKSRGVGVFGNDAQDTGIPADVWRFYLIYQRPESQDSSFCWTDLQVKNNSELLNNLGNFVNRALTFLFNNFGGVVPEMNLTEDDKVVIASVSRKLTYYIELMDNVRLRDSIRCILSISRIGNQYIQFHKPWELIKGTPEARLRAGTIMGISANIACLASQLIHPFMPEASETLRMQLSVPRFELGPHFVQLLKPGHKINKPEPLFKKIEQATIEDLKQRFKGEPQNLERKMVGGNAFKVVNHVKEEDSGDVQKLNELTELVQLQGNKVRELKAAKADKALIDIEVDQLLHLKKELTLASHQEPIVDQKLKKKKKK